MVHAGDRAGVPARRCRGACGRGYIGRVPSGLAASKWSGRIGITGPTVDRRWLSRLSADCGSERVARLPPRIAARGREWRGRVGERCDRLKEGRPPQRCRPFFVYSRRASHPDHFSPPDRQAFLAAEPRPGGYCDPRPPAPRVKPSSWPCRCISTRCWSASTATTSASWRRPGQGFGIVRRRARARRWRSARSRRRCCRRR